MRVRLLLSGLAAVAVLLHSTPIPAAAAAGSAFAGAGRLDAFSCNVEFEFCLCDRGQKGECEKMEELVCKAGTKDCNSTKCWCDMKVQARPGRSKQMLPTAPTLRMQRR